MEAIEGILGNTTIADIVKRARDSAYPKRLTPEQEKSSKDIGGVLVPSAFQVPNEIVDEGWLCELSGGEIKVLLYIIRKTFGFNKIAGDKIPLSQIIEGTGLSRRAAVDSTRVLEQCKLVATLFSSQANNLQGQGAEVFWQ